MKKLKKRNGIDDCLNYIKNKMFEQQNEDYYLFARSTMSHIMKNSMTHNDIKVLLYELNMNMGFTCFYYRNYFVVFKERLYGENYISQKNKCKKIVDNISIYWNIMNIILIFIFMMFLLMLCYYMK